MHTRGHIFTISKAWIRKGNNLGCNKIQNLSKSKRTEIHTQLKNPTTKPLQLSCNLQSVAHNEFGRFSPQLNDLPTINTIPVINKQNDALVFYYNNVKHSCMQYHVANLFRTKKTTGQWAHQVKFVSNEMHMRTFHTLCNRVHTDQTNVLHRYESNKASPEASADKEVAPSRKDQLKRAVKEYGSTVIIFHVGISLVSLGTCYILISSGLDVGQVLVPLGLGGSVASNAGTFITAYAIHKVFAPVRISITLGATPFIVRYLRNIGFLKQPKTKLQQ